MMFLWHLDRIMDIFQKKTLLTYGLRQADNPGLISVCKGPYSNNEYLRQFEAMYPLVPTMS